MLHGVHGSIDNTFRDSMLLDAARDRQLSLYYPMTLYLSSDTMGYIILSFAGNAFQFFPSFCKFFCRANFVFKPFLLPLITFHVALVVMQYTCLPFNTEIHFKPPAISKANGRLIHINKAVRYFLPFIIGFYLFKMCLALLTYYTFFKGCFIKPIMHRTV